MVLVGFMIFFLNCHNVAKNLPDKRIKTELLLVSLSLKSKQTQNLTSQAYLTCAEYIPAIFNCRVIQYTHPENKTGVQSLLPLYSQKWAMWKTKVYEICVFPTGRQEEADPRKQDRFLWENKIVRLVVLMYQALKICHVHKLLHL